MSDHTTTGTYPEVFEVAGSTSAGTLKKPRTAVSLSTAQTAEKARQSTMAMNAVGGLVATGGSAG